MLRNRIPLWLSTACRDAAAVAACCAVFSLAFNAIRSNGIPLIQKKKYQLFIPCPEVMGEVESISPFDARPYDAGALVIDAREKARFDEWHLPGALNVPFDYLAATPPSAVNSVASSGARIVLVYGDGNDPDSGLELAKELVGRGIRNVRHVRGGAAALMAGGAADEMTGR